jgi:predicted translin family RNA/ssDNA-binding protein
MLQTILSRVKNYSVVYYERLKAITDKVDFCREAFNYFDRLYNLGIISTAEYSEALELISKYLKQNERVEQ